jgi:ABC-type multidrug transport system ATPase subunit
MRQLEAKIIEFSELEEFIDLPIKYYSSGMHGRLAFSIGAIVEPEILLVDEIFATGDAHFVQKATDRMRHLFNSSGITLLVSHNLHQILDLCNRVIVMHKGEIVGDGPPAEMINYYVNDVAHLLKPAAAAAVAPPVGIDSVVATAPAASVSIATAPPAPASIAPTPLPGAAQSAGTAPPVEPQLVVK